MTTKTLSSWLFAAVLACVLVAARPARAQYVPMDFTPQVSSSMFLSTSYLSSQALLDSTARRATARTASTITQPAATSRTAAALAQTFPASTRAHATQLFEQLLAVYPKLEHQLGIPAGDLGGAAAVFLLAAYEAATDREVDARYYGAVIAQVRAAIANQPAFAKTPAAERRGAYEQLAILGMYIATVKQGLKQQPDAQLAQRVREAARGYLAQFGIAADRMSVGSAGLAIAGGEPRADAAPPADTAPPADAPRADAPPSSRTDASRPDASRSDAARSDASRTDAARSDASAVATKGIVAVVMRQTTGSGYNGWITIEYKPTVLFDTGDALLDIAGLGDAAGPVAHRRAHPGAWTRWRRARGGYELADGADWEAARTTLPPVRGTVSGTWTSESYAGWVAGGGTSMAWWGTVQLDSKGGFRIQRGGGNTGPSHTYVAADEVDTGTYEIAGYQLTLRHADGRVERTQIVFTAKRDMMWLRGATYTRKD